MSDVRMPFVKLLQYTAACAALGMFVFCSNGYDPFTDPVNARAIVKYKSFNDVDTTSIFSTETLQVVVSGRDLVDSFSVTSSANRFFTDSTVRARPAPTIPAIVFTFFMSFIDTGWQDVSVCTFRKNNEKLSVDYSLYCTSPLHQNDINATYGDSIALSTKPVKDASVLYHWDFGNGLVFEKTQPGMVVRITSLLSGKQGALWVSDNMEKNSSAKALFSFSLTDTSGPTIVCINDSVRHDTIQTSDSTFTFLARINDLQNTSIASASVNGQPFDFVDHNQNVYLKIFYGVAAYQPVSPLVLNIKATDIFGNLSEKVFDLVYNAAVNHQGGLVILVKSPLLDANNAALSSTQGKFLFGSLENYSTAPFVTVLRLWVNGVLQANTDTLAAAPSGLWNFNSTLAVGPNRITVAAFKLNGDSCAGVSFTLNYDPSTGADDKTPPVVLDISTGGTQNFYTAGDSLTMRIIAVDEGTGIRGLTVNGNAIASSAEGKGYIWYDTLKTFHSHTLGRTLIAVTDSNGNSFDTLVYIYKNNLPQVLAAPFRSGPLVAGTTYRDTMVATDLDYDTVQISKASGPAALTVSLNGNVEWTPSAGDTGQHILTVGLFDGYQTKTYSCTLYVVMQTGTQVPPVRFVTTVQDFPKYLQAGKDSLAVTLQTVNGVLPLEFSALVRETNTIILLEGNVVRWRPGVSDTGLSDLMLVVSDQMKRGDTLRPAILVLPPNRPFTLSVSFTGARTSDSMLDMSKAIGPDTLRFFINDPDVPLVEQHTVRIVQSHIETVNTVDSSRSFMIILDPGRVSASILRDTIEVIVTDRAGHADSAMFGVVYHTAAPQTKKIVMNTTSGSGGAAVSGTVTKFPVLVRLDRTNFDFSVVNNAGSPLGFKKSDGSPLAFEIERWDSLDGLVEIWVLVDTVFGNDSTHSITMSWDAAGPTPQSQSSTVFDTTNGFQAVWHLSEAANAGALDATVNAYNGTPNGSPIDTTGVIGHAKVFNGQTSCFSMSNTASGKLNFPLNGPSTISAWVNVAVLDGNFHCIISKSDRQYALQVRSSNQLEFMEFDNVQGWLGVLAPAVTQTWKYVVGVRNGANQYLYVDGLLADGTITVNQATGRDVSNDVTIGRISVVTGGTGNRFFNGKIDEACMANVARSADWIKLCYENQKPGSTFITVK